MENVIVAVVVLAAAVVEVGEEADDGQVAIGRDQELAVAVNSLPVGDAVKLTQRPAVDCPLLYLLDVDHGWLLSVFISRR